MKRIICQYHILYKAINIVVYYIMIIIEQQKNIVKNINIIY
jgi:hypothetical protein